MKIILFLSFSLRFFPITSMESQVYTKHLQKYTYYFLGISLDLNNVTFYANILFISYAKAIQFSMKDWASFYNILISSLLMVYSSPFFIFLHLFVDLSSPQKES